MLLFSYVLLCFLEHCQIWKFPRTEDKLPENIGIEALKHEQEISVEGATLRVHHTPGHTTDHVVMHFLEENAVFSGDCVLGEGTAVFEDLYSYMRSLQDILDIDPAIIYPGHGNVINDPTDKINFYIDHRMEREQQILEALSNNRKQFFGENDLVNIIYVDLDENLVKAAENNVNHHLKKLLKENKVIYKNNLWQYNEF